MNRLGAAGSSAMAMAVAPPVAASKGQSDAHCPLDGVKGEHRVERDVLVDLRVAAMEQVRRGIGALLRDVEVQILGGIPGRVGEVGHRVMPDRGGASDRDVVARAGADPGAAGQLERLQGAVGRRAADVDRRDVDAGAAPSSADPCPAARRRTLARPAATRPAARCPVARCPAARCPAATCPAAKSPAAKSPVATCPAARCPAAKSLAAKSPAARSPGCSVRPPPIAGSASNTRTTTHRHLMAPPGPTRRRGFRRSRREIVDGTALRLVRRQVAELK